ncbi:hypothetical protein niasHT_035032 [Heterodera trifolii]|uniref:Uncharacterized protein n=1 Tax=Heterodera trifolii TaxID=157864 RepID=A0ABD2IU78_9BILA
MECSAISAGVQKDTKMAGINCECQFGLKNADFGNRKLSVTPKGRTTTTVSTTEKRTKRTRTTTESTSTTKPSPSLANVKIGNKMQCMAKNICDLNEMWKRAKLTKRFEIRKKCEEMVKNWEQMTKEISTEYENADNKNSALNKNGQVFLADFISARIH